jgi:SpoIID/LytB domain protein
VLACSAVRRALPTALAVALLAAPAAASAAQEFTFTGRGWGHGVGMPQYGAYGAAKAGWDVGRILAYYYRGATIARADGGAVRVLLASGRSRLRVRSPGDWQAVDETTTPNTAVALRPGAEYKLRPRGTGVALRGPGGRVLAVYTGAIRLQPVSRGGVVDLDGRPYRGAMRVLSRDGRLLAVNVVDLEQYLDGVVPREVSPDWGDDAPAALQAQAIAARSYAIATLDRGADYDLRPDQTDQVYGGAAAEDPRTTAAVEATRGRVLTYDGKVIVAFFFASSGGRTEDVQNVFPTSAPEPYLTSVSDPFDRGSPFHTWGAADRRTLSGAALGRALGAPGPVVRATVLRRGASPRVMDLRLTTAAGATLDVTGSQVRKALGLRDTWFFVGRTTGPGPGGAAAGRS